MIIDAALNTCFLITYFLLNCLLIQSSSVETNAIYSEYVFKWIGKTLEINGESQAIILSVHYESKSECAIAFQLKLSKTRVHGTIIRHKDTGKKVLTLPS